MLSKKVTKSKIGSKGFNLVKNWFHPTAITSQSLMLTFYLFIYLFLHIKFSCSSNITARISKTKCQKKLVLSRCSGGLSTVVANIFIRGGRKSDIMDFLR